MDRRSLPFLGEVIFGSINHIANGRRHQTEAKNLKTPTARGRGGKKERVSPKFGLREF